MAGRKAVCCGLSILETVLAVLLVIMTGVCIALITVMVVNKTHKGKNTHTPDIKQYVFVC